MRGAVFVVVAAVAAFAACEDSPAEPTKTVSSLSMSPATDWIKLRATEKFTVTALYSTGASEVVTPAWTSDATTVATVDAAGTVTGVAAGLATIAAAFQGQSVTRTLRVIPDYAGRWAGSWDVTSCTVQGDFISNWCAPVNNGSFPATLEILQTKDVVSATWVFQEATGSHPGTIAPAGPLSLTGSSFQSGVRIEIVSWQTVTTDNRTMTGTFTLRWTTDGRSGSAQTVIALRNFAKQ
jgi:hypothetical protein